CLPGGVCQSGQCGCPAGGNEGVCNGQCTDRNTDRNNCGACNKVCAAQQSCVGGQCICDAGVSLCNGSCVNLPFADLNCNTWCHQCDTSHGYHCSGGQWRSQPEPGVRLTSKAAARAG